MVCCAMQKLKNKTGISKSNKVDVPSPELAPGIRHHFLQRNRSALFYSILKGIPIGQSWFYIRSQQVFYSKKHCSGVFRYRVFSFFSHE